jgi:hypothetical protein
VNLESILLQTKERKLMADEKMMNSPTGDETTGSGMKPDTTPDPTHDVNPVNDDRTLDIGESGQFAPGGRYNELEATKPRRIDLDEEVDSALGKDKG